MGGLGGGGNTRAMGFVFKKKKCPKKALFHQTYPEKPQFGGRRSVRIKKVHNNEVVEDKKGHRRYGVYC